MTQSDSGETDTLGAPAAEPSAAPIRSPAPRRGGFVGGLLGGVVAAAAGYGVAQYVPNGWPLADTSALQAEVAAQAQDNAALKAQITELASVQAKNDLTARVMALENAPLQATPVVDLAPLEARIAMLESQMTAIESMPVGAGGVSPAVIAAQDAGIKQLQAQIQALQAAESTATTAADAQLKAAQDAADTMKADAAQLVKTIQQTAALGRIQAALDSGAPFASALPDLGDIPEALVKAANSGVPTLAILRETFPDAARAGLDAALRANMGETWSDRVASFLRTQTGARSLTPREGPDPDAVLSRAEADLAAGDVDAALSEITALPDVAQVAMAEWRQKAETRQVAVAAVATLTAALGQ